MSGKNRTIPLVTKQEAEVQTQVNLVNHEQLRDNVTVSEEKQIRFSRIISENILLKSFSNSQVFEQLSHLIDDLKRQGTGTQSTEKRIALIQKQLQGLMKRSLLVNQKLQNLEASSDYYSLINQKEKEKLKMEYQMAYNGTKLQRYERKIQELQKQISSLLQTINFTKNAVAQNKIYKDFINSLKEDKRIDTRKFTDLQNQLKKLNNLSIKQSKISQNNFEEETYDLSGYFVNEIEKLKKQGKISKDKLNQAIYSFYHLNSDFNSEISTNFEFKSKYQALESKYRNLVSIFKHQVEDFQKQNPSIKGLKNFEDLINLTNQNQSEVEFINITGWVGIGKLSRAGTASSSSTIQSTEQKKLLTTFAKQIKIIIDRYPKLISQLNQQVRFFFQKGQFLQELIQADSFGRLKQIITYQPEIIRVDNVYQYSNKKDQSLIFNLRVLIKSLFEQFERIKQKHQIQITLDAGILQMMKSQIIQGIDVDQILTLYRPLPRVIEVQKIVQKPVYVNGTLEKGIAIRTERAVLAQAFTEKAVQVIKQVPVFIQKIINNPVKQFVEVNFQNQKIVEVPTIREVIAEKVVLNEKLNDVEVQKIVPLYEEKFVEIQNNREVVVQRTKIVQIQRPVQLPGQKQYIQIEKIVQKPIYLRETKQKLKEIQVINQKIFQRDRYIQIERAVPHVITNRQTVYLDRQVPRFITNTEQREVNVTQIIQKIVPYRVVEERVIEVPVVQEKQVVREIEKEVLVEMTHFIKGDRQEIIKEVQVIVEKPYREEFLITKQLQIEKVVPLYFKEEKPVYVEMHMPYVQAQPKIINQQISKIVPVREQVIKEVRIEVPVPVIVEKEVIKIQTVFVDRIIEKIVQVPRVVEIEKIVEKIVPIPRIIEKIVEVPRYIERIVTVQVPCLQIVEVFRQIPVIRQVQVIKEVIIERSVIQFVKQIEIVDREKIVEIVIQKQVPKQVEVERRIPTEIIKQIPVEVFRDRIVQKIIQIHEVTIKDREVIVPFKQQIPIQFIVEKPVVTQKIVQHIVKVPQVIEKEKAITSTITIPEIVEVRIQKAIQIQVVRQIPGPETIKYIEVPKQIQLLKQKIIQVESIIQVPKQVYLYMDKIVHEYHQRLHPIQVPKIIEQPYIVQVQKPQHYIHYKEIPVQVQTNRNVPIRTIINEIKEVSKEIHHETEIEIVRQRIKQIIKQQRQYIERQVEKQILREVVINQTKIQTIEIPSEPKLIETMNTTIQIQSNDNYIEKVVERIVMLPQIVQVVKHLHQITQIQSPGIAHNVTIQQHSKQFTSVSVELKTSLTQLLDKFRQNQHRQPDLKALIPILESNLKQVQKWISFPKLIQIEKQTCRDVQVEKVVLVPTSDHKKQATLSYLVQKLITQLKRIKERNRIQLQLDEDIQRLFFKDSRTGLTQVKFEQLDKKFKTMYGSMGDWTQSYPFMINSFLQDYFTLNSTIDEVSNVNQSLKEQIQILQSQLKKNSQQIIYLSSHNSQILRNYSLLLEALNNTEKNNQDLTKNQIKSILNQHTLKKSQVRQLQKMSEKQVISSRVTISRQSYKIEESIESTNNQISTLISKTSKLQSDKQQLTRANRNYEKQIKILQSQLDRLRLNQQSRLQQSRSSKGQSEVSNTKIIDDIRNRMTAENQQKLKRLQQSQTQEIQRLKSQKERQIQKLKAGQQKQIQRLRQQKSTASNADLNNENRKVSEKLRNTERQLEAEKRSLESLKQQHERQLQNLKKQHELNLQKKDSNISSIESVKTRISQDYQRKIKQLKQVHEKQLDRIKSTSMKKEDIQKDAHKDDKQKQVNDLRDKIKKLQIQLDTSKRQVEIYQQQKSKLIGTTAYTGSIFTSGVKQSQIAERYSPEQMKYSRVETYQSAIEKKYVSPSSIKSKEDDSSSRKSSSSKRSERSSKYKSQMTLRQFMELEQNEDRDICATFIMIKIIQKIEEETVHGMLHSFGPSNIYLSNLNPKNLESLSIKFGAPIVNKNNKTDGLYLAPQTLAGQKTSEKSVVFTLAVIWDQLIHGSVFFKSMKDIESSQVQFKVRDAKLNPILKNTLFEMMNKDPSKRLQLHQTKRRLSLQKYIASESNR